MENLGKNMQDKIVFQITYVDFHDENCCWHAVTFLSLVFFLTLKKVTFQTDSPSEPWDANITEKKNYFSALSKWKNGSDECTYAFLLGGLASDCKW